MGALNRRAVSSGLERSDLLNPAALDRVVEEAMRRVHQRVREDRANSREAFEEWRQWAERFMCRNVATQEMRDAAAVEREAINAAYRPAWDRHWGMLP